MFSSKLLKDPTGPGQSPIVKVLGLGFNTSGTLGDNSNLNRSSPVQIGTDNPGFLSVVTGGAHTLVIKNDYTLWVTGDNTYGQLGQGNTLAKNSFVQVLAGTNSFVWVGGGNYHSAAIDTSGTLYTWGRNNAGQVGNNTTTNRSVPVSIFASASKVHCGLSQTMVLKTDGTLWIWGSGNNGATGLSTTTSRSSPVQLSTVGTVNDFWCTSFNGMYLNNSGALYIWGDNSVGQLGLNLNSTVHRSTQTAISGKVFKKLFYGYATYGGYDTSDAAWMWGRANQGEMGTGAGINRSSPVQVSAAILANTRRIELTGSNLLLFRTDGTIWGSGINVLGQLGQNDTMNRSSPVQIATQIVTASSGGQGSCLFLFQNN